MTRLVGCRQIWYEFCENSTFHGVPHTVRDPQLWMRAVWMVLVAVGIIATLVPVALYIKKYERKIIDIETKVSTKVRWLHFSLAARQCMLLCFISINVIWFYLHCIHISIMEMSYEYRKHNLVNIIQIQIENHCMHVSISDSEICFYMLWPLCCGNCLTYYVSINSVVTRISLL